MNDNRPTFPGYGHYQPRPKDTTRRPALADNGPDLLAENERLREAVINLKAVARHSQTCPTVVNIANDDAECHCGLDNAFALANNALAGGRGE